MEYFKKLSDIDTLPMLAEIKSEHWKADTYLRDYPQGPFGDTESIILRFPDRSVHETEAALANHIANFDQHENVWQCVAADFPATEAICLDLMRAVHGTRLGRIMINKVAPGGKIYRHADTPVHSAYWSRFHIVLHALPGNDFYCHDEMVNMLTGEIWYFRNDLEHEVINNSGDYRIHVVVDILTDIVKLPPVKKYGSGITYQLELFRDVIDELKPFVPIHWAELGLTQQEVPVDFDWDRFIELENKNGVQLVVARDYGKVIGYQVTLIGSHLHYKSTIHGMVDLYFLLKEYRQGRTGLKMMQFAEKCMKDAGVVKIITGCKVHLNHKKLFEFMGYTHSDLQFYKIL